MEKYCDKDKKDKSMASMFKAHSLLKAIKEKKKLISDLRSTL